MTIPENCGVCPKCKGTKRRPLPENMRRYAPHLATYDGATDTLACDNCGGQTMSLTATGYTKKSNPHDTEGCLHKFAGRNAGNCYTIYTCKFCGQSYDIDSGG